MTSSIKTGQFAELLAQLTAAKLGMWTSPEEKQADLLRRLRDRQDAEWTFPGKVESHRPKILV
ncbi:hypothetical protein M2352_004416 [Azospirillum fermentarium]|uniref:hypothetical protein n=1 Tax=Azospirillum fermentarium TaxID=1233114 RepID=UPI002226F964|nr:hypothetical protein [Azospirillum fermentarium]MCW2248756.1 hypothetical protein [Azospirillum fermentarium]